MSKFFEDQRYQPSQQQPRPIPAPAPAPVAPLQPAPVARPFLNWKWLAGIGCLLITFLILIPAIAGAVWFFWPVHDHEENDRDSHGYAVTNPGEAYIVGLANGLYEASEIIIRKAEANEFSDLGDVEKVWAPLQSSVRARALEPFKEQVFSKLNGSSFSNEGVADAWRMLQKGYGESIQ